MSRFWTAASSDDESQSDHSDSSEEPQNLKQTDKKFAGAFDESDSDSEDEVREVKSQKDRTWDSIRDGIVKIKNAQKNNDWSQIQDEFANVNKLIEKSKMLILQNGLPPFYIKMLAEVEDHVAGALKDKEAVKKMKPVVARALNQMKLQVRKHNDAYKEQITDFRANPTKYEDHEAEKVKAVSKKNNDSSSDSDSESESSDGSDSSSESSSASESESESSDSEPDEQLTGRARWLKKPDTKDVKAKPKPKPVVHVQNQQAQKEFVFAEVKRPAWRVEDKMTEEELDKKVAELVSSRGRKGVDQRDMLRQLEVLTKSARLHGAVKEIPVLMHLISTMFDTQKSIDDYMDHQQWNTCYRALSRVVTLIEENHKLRVVTLGTDEMANAVLSLSKLDLSSVDVSSENVVRVVGSVDSFVLRLEEEYTKSLQQINPHTQEYVARLANEAALVELEERILHYFKRIGDMKAAAIVALLIVEHLYYKHDSHATAVNQAHHFNKKWGVYSALHPACKGKGAAFPDKNRDSASLHPASFLGHPTVVVHAVDFCKKLEDLSSFIFEHGDERGKTRALLCSVYYHALHDRYYKARDLFLISHVHDFIDKAEVKTQILYNRTVVTVGLCAFRLGLFNKAHDCLSTICSGRTKELLAQGTTRSPDKDIEQEKQERRRQIPYHMHINPELLECCHLTCAMILELPNLARGLAGVGNHNIISRQLRKHLGIYNKQAFVGPPESTREHVLAATKSVLSGDWRRACGYLLDLEVWNLIPGEGGSEIKQLLRVRIQEEAIRCHLLLNCDSYDSVDLSSLCTMFEMDRSQVRRIICHMIFNKEISASWEHSGSVLVLFKVDPSPLQVISTTVAEKLAQFLESNERIVDSLVGVYGYKDDWNVRDNRKHFNNAPDGQNRKRHLGWKTSNRPIVGKTQKGQGNNRGRSNANGTNPNGPGARSAWSQNKPRKQYNNGDQTGYQKKMQNQS